MAQGNNRNARSYRDLDRSSRSSQYARRRRRRRRRLNPFPIVVYSLLLLAIIGFVVYGSHNIWYAKPKLALIGEAEQVVEAGTVYEDPGVTATLKNADISDQVQVQGEVNTSQVSTMTRMYAVEYRGQTYSISRKITVVDNTPPVINLTEPEGGVVVSSIDKYEEPGFTALDAGDGDVTTRVQSQLSQLAPEQWKVTYTVTDSSGNTATAERQVTIREDAPAPSASGDSGESIICLTFDDGPSDKVTPQILDTLKANDVKATFFIVRYEDSMIPLLQRMVAEGHTIGIHTWNHDYNVCYATRDSYYEGVVKLAEKLKNDIGYEAFCCRFPGGSSNTVSRKYTEGVMTYLAERMPAEGYQYYDWNADSTDAEGNNRDPDVLYQNSINGFKKGRTNILLCHDLNTKQTTADMLQRLINYGKENGYTFQPITKDTTPVHHGINN